MYLNPDNPIDGIDGLETFHWQEEGELLERIVNFIKA